MRRAIAVVLVLAVAAFAAASAGGRTSAGALVTTAYNKQLKKVILVDSRGMTLYLFYADTGGVATCKTIAPSCPKIWPQLTSLGAPRAGKGVKASLLGTTMGANGKPQVTHNKPPLYYFHGGSGAGPGDTKPGDANGQGFSAYWYVVSPKGTAIK